MIYTHSLKKIDMDLDSCIAGHSGDETIVYRTVGAEPVCLSMYYPTGRIGQERRPGFLFIHGGGWAGHKVFEGEAGWQGDYLGFLARYYADRGYVCASIDYRLLEENGQKEGAQLIDLYDDCAEAADYVLDRAAEYGIDPGRVYILGESAGGHLAGLLAAKYQSKGVRFRAAFLVNAITDLWGDEKWRQRAPLKSCHPKLKGLSWEESARALSPLYCISEEICPIVLLHGTLDHVVSPGHSESFYERMQKVGGRCELHWIEDTDHAFLLAEYTQNTAACKTGIEIIDNYLERDK